MQSFANLVLDLRTTLNTIGTVYSGMERRPSLPAVKGVVSLQEDKELSISSKNAQIESIILEMKPL